MPPITPARTRSLMDRERVGWRAVFIGAVGRRDARSLAPIGRRAQPLQALPEPVRGSLVGLPRAAHMVGAPAHAAGAGGALDEQLGGGGEAAFVQPVVFALQVVFGLRRA